MSSRRLSSAEIDEKIAEQLAFLDTSCKQFDAGNRGEAARLATTCRVLLHNTASSHALLVTAGKLNRLEFPDVGKDFPQQHEVSTDGKSLKTTIGVFFRLVELQLPFAGESPKFPARLEDVAQAPKRSFNEWWNRPVLRSSNGLDAPARDVTRRQIVLGLANKEGGAHVDPDPNLEWWMTTKAGIYGCAQVRDDGSISVSTPMGQAALDGGAPGEVASPVNDTMRVIAAEVLHALGAVAPLPEVSTEGPAHAWVSSLFLEVTRTRRQA